MSAESFVYIISFILIFRAIYNVIILFSSLKVYRHKKSSEDFSGTYFDLCCSYMCKTSLIWKVRKFLHFQFYKLTPVLVFLQSFYIIAQVVLSIIGFIGVFLLKESELWYLMTYKF